MPKYVCKALAGPGWNYVRPQRRRLSFSISKTTTWPLRAICQQLMLEARIGTFSHLPKVDP